MNFNVNRVKINVTVPIKNLEEVRNAICETGAGIIGNYTYCSMSTKCIGTFKPNDNANPYIGENNKLEFVEEEKLEVVCDVNNVKKVISKLREVHPYEEPAIDIVPLLDEENFNYKEKKMNRQFAEEWLNKLKVYWFNKDIENAVLLFTKTTFYQETPFMEPYTTIDEINEEWQHVKNENIQNIEIKLLAIDGYTIIAEWILKQNNEEFDGIYEIKFNNNLECIYFKSWEMVQ